MKYERNKIASPEKYQDMEESRLAMLDEAGIDEMDVISVARQNVAAWTSYFSDNNTRGKDDMEFLCVDQWNSIERSEFIRLRKTPLVINKLYDMVKKISGEQRMNRPDLLVRSMTGKSTQEQIDLRADLVRTISYQSQNNLVYQMAFDNALFFGYGAFQVAIEYEKPKSFNQVIRYYPVPDPRMCGFDPLAQKPHKGDGNYCYNMYIYSKSEFYAENPHIQDANSYVDDKFTIEFPFESRDSIIVCDYYQKEWFPTTIYELNDGRTVNEFEWEEIEKETARVAKIIGGNSPVDKILKEMLPERVDERSTKDFTLMQYRLIKDKIIEFTEWPGKLLPMVFVDGDSKYIDGKQHTRSFAHIARDAQKFLNYTMSELATEMKNRRREQWLGTQANIEGNEEMWRNPETQQGILIAEIDPKSGSMPQKLPPSEIPQTLLGLYERTTQDLHELTGFHAANLGQESNETSGIAIANRAIQGSASASVYFDNFTSAIEQGGRINLELLPHVYSKENRHMVVTKPNGTTQSVILNSKGDQGQDVNTLTGGEYDIEIDTGPSFAVQKAESLKLFMQLASSGPQILPLVADLMAENMDIQKRNQVVERFKTLVPPAILAKEEGRPPPPPQPDPQQQAMQMQQQLAQAQLKEREQEIQVRQAKLELDKEKHQLDQMKMMLEAEKLKAQMRGEHFDRHAGHHATMHKHDLDYSAKIANTLAGMHKGHETNEHT
jgi:hypothetical protein